MISKNQIRQVTALHQKKYREEHKLFIAEGKKIVDELIRDKPSLIKELFASGNYIGERKHDLDQKRINTTVVTAEELKKISTLATPQDALAVCHFVEEKKTDFDFSTKVSLYLDDIRDPGNMGTILRTADWFGIEEIFCSRNSTDIYNSKTIQSAMGSFLRVGVNYIDLKELATKYSPRIYGAVLDGKNIYNEKLKPGLIIVGNEANGISKENLSLITDPVTIPSAKSSKAESLNAAIAASIISSEFFRQLNS